MIKLLVNISEQKLYVKNQNKTLKTYFISTGKAGVGQESGSYKTPLGCHEICEKIGAECLINTIFVGRKPTGDIYSEEFALKNNNNDFILTRILWLSGLEPGKNLGDRSTLKVVIFTSMDVRIVVRWAFRYRMDVFACGILTLSNYLSELMLGRWWISSNTQLRG